MLKFSLLDVIQYVSWIIFSCHILCEALSRFAK